MCRKYFWIVCLWIVSKGLPLESSGEIICGKADKYFESCFNGTNSHSRKSRKLNIPNDNEDVEEHCNYFEVGMRCYNEYSEKCMVDQTSKRLLDNEVIPAKNFYEMLCKDKLFKKDYLKHKDCYGWIEKDWLKCTESFHIIVNQEFTRVEREKKSNIDTQFMHFCCARYGYENCVYNSAKAKCKSDSARFTKSLVELLSSGKQFKNCAKIEESLCSSANRVGFLFNSILPLVLVENLFRYLMEKTWF